VQVEEFNKDRAAYHLLDVREDDEWQAGHIDGAQHIPLGELGERLAEVPTGKTVVAVCRSGSRSAAVVRGLLQIGRAAENLEGGVTAWTRAGLPLIDGAGRPGRVI
jgi:rhodanese-related sulfurtransferase